MAITIRLSCVGSGATQEAVYFLFITKSNHRLIYITVYLYGNSLIMLQSFLNQSLQKNLEFISYSLLSFGNPWLFLVLKLLTFRVKLSSIYLFGVKKTKQENFHDFPWVETQINSTLIAPLIFKIQSKRLWKDIEKTSTFDDFSLCF